MIGVSNGEQYEDSFAHAIATMPPGWLEKPTDALNKDSGTQVALTVPTPANDNKNLQIPTPNMDDIFERQWNDMVKKALNLI